MSYLRYLCLLAHSDVQHILCCVFVLFFFVLCTLCCQFLWIVFSIYQIILVYAKIKFCIYILYKILYLPDINTSSEHVIDTKTRINDNHIQAFGQCSAECSDKQYINEQWTDLIGDGCIGRF
jgi:hypothetical protein